MYILNIFKAVCNLNYAIFSKSSDSPSNFKILGPPKLISFLKFQPAQARGGLHAIFLYRWTGIGTQIMSPNLLEQGL